LEKNTTAVGRELTVCCENHRGERSLRTISRMWRYSEDQRLAIVGNGVKVVVRKTEWVGCLHRLNRISLPFRLGKTWTTERVQRKPSSRSEPIYYSGHIGLRFIQIYGSRQSMGNCLFGQTKMGPCLGRFFPLASRS